MILCYLLVIWHLANENLSNLQRHVRVVVHLLFSENSDVSSNSEGERKNTFVNKSRMLLWCIISEPSLIVTCQKREFDHICDLLLGHLMEGLQRRPHVLLRESHQHAVVLNADLIDGFTSTLLQAPFHLRCQVLKAILCGIHQL